ncbi:unnamed protein product, partial [Nesidiocoris tenuis]
GGAGMSEDGRVRRKRRSRIPVRQPTGLYVHSSPPTKKDRRRTRGRSPWQRGEGGESAEERAASFPGAEPRLQFWDWSAPQGGHPWTCAAPRMAAGQLPEDCPCQQKATCPEKRNPLHYASGNEDVWRRLVAYGADTTTLDVEGNSPAVYMNHPRRLRPPAPETRSKATLSNQGTFRATNITTNTTFHLPPTSTPTPPPPTPSSTPPQTLPPPSPFHQQHHHPLNHHQHFDQYHHQHQHHHQHHHNYHHQTTPRPPPLPLSTPSPLTNTTTSTTTNITTNTTSHQHQHQPLPHHHQHYHLYHHFTTNTTPTSTTITKPPSHHHHHHHLFRILIFSHPQYWFIGTHLDFYNNLSYRTMHYPP